MTDKEFALSIKRIADTEGFRNLISYLENQVSVFNQRRNETEISDVRIEKQVKKKAIVYITVIDKDDNRIISLTYNRILQKLTELLKMRAEE